MVLARYVFAFMVLLSSAFAAETEAPTIVIPPPTPLMKLYFFPFTAFSQGLIRKQDIERHNDESLWFLQPQPFIEHLRQMLEARPTEKHLRNNAIRLKVEFPQDGATFYVDRYGIVEKNEQETFQLLPEEMNQIQREIPQYKGVVDLKSTRRLLEADLFPR